MCRGKIEADRDHRLRLPLADKSAVGAGAEGEAERIEKDRLARAGLAGQDAEARTELKIEAFNQDDVADGKPGQHGALRPSPIEAPALRVPIKVEL